MTRKSQQNGSTKTGESGTIINMHASTRTVYSRGAKSPTRRMKHITRREELSEGETKVAQRLEDRRENKRKAAVTANAKNGPLLEAPPLTELEMAEIEDMVEALLKRAVDAGSEVSDEEASKILKSLSGSDSSTPSVEGSQDNSTDQQSCDTEEVAAALIQLNIATPSQPRVHRAAAARARAQPRPAAEPTRRSQRQRSKAPQAAASEGVPAVADGPAAAAEQVQLPGSCRDEVAAPPRTRGRKRSRSASASAAATPCRSCRTRVASPEKESTPCQQPTAASAGRAASAAACTRARPDTGNRRGGGKKRSGGRKSARRPAKAAASAPAEVPAPEQPPAQQPAVQSADTNTAPEAPAAAQAPRIRFKIPEGSSLLLENKPPSPTLMRKDSEPPLAPAADICAAGCTSPRVQTTEAVNNEAATAAPKPGRKRSRAEVAPSEGQQTAPRRFLRRRLQ